MAKLSEEKIAEIKEAYKRLGTYAAVAREVGVSASTARKYALGEAGAPATKAKTIVKLPRMNFNGKISSDEEALQYFSNYTNFGDVCKLSKNEEAAVIEFLKEA